MITTGDVTVDVEPPHCYQIKIPVVPVPASRPRMARKSGRVYYGKRYTEFRRDCDFLLNSVEWMPCFPLDKLLAVSVKFLVPRPKKTKRLVPRGDVDNYFKSLDVLNDVVWRDDDQIVWASMTKQFADEGSILLEVMEVDKILETRRMSELWVEG